MRPIIQYPNENWYNEVHFSTIPSLFTLKENWFVSRLYLNSLSLSSLNFYMFKKRHKLQFKQKPRDIEQVLALYEILCTCTHFKCRKKDLPLSFKSNGLLLLVMISIKFAIWQACIVQTACVLSDLHVPRHLVCIAVQRSDTKFTAGVRSPVLIDCFTVLQQYHLNNDPQVVVMALKRGRPSFKTSLCHFNAMKRQFLVLLLSKIS